MTITPTELRELASLDSKDVVREALREAADELERLKEEEVPVYSSRGDCSFKFELPIELRLKFKAIAEANGFSQSELMRVLIQEFVDEMNSEETTADGVTHDH
jgi:hypothetical protein